VRKALAAAAFCFTAIVPAQQTPLTERVLVLVNDRMPKEAGTGNVGAGIFVGQHYAARRGIPAANVFHVKTTTDENISGEDFKSQIEAPLRKLLDANEGAMRGKILCIVPTYGVPVQIDRKLSVDSVLSVMYAGHEDLKPPLRNPYYGPVGSRPPHFDEWSRQFQAAGGFKMFLVTRLDGPSATIAAGLVDKAMEAERSLTLDSGTAYFDYQGTRVPSDWQYAVDEEIKAASELSRKRGFRTVLHTQRDSLCRCSIPPASQYRYEATARYVAVNAMGGRAEAAFAFAPLEEGEFTVRLKDLGVQNIGNSIELTLSDAPGSSFIRLRYPLVPFTNWEVTDSAALEKVLGGTKVASATLKLDKSGEKEINTVSELRVSVRKNSITAYRDGRSLLAAEDKTAALKVTRVTFGLQCATAGLAGFTVANSAGAPLWSDDFATDSTTRYQWKTTPPGGLDALWVWGWYTAAFDSYRFVPGAVGAQLTSFTALKIRTPQNADPRLQSWSSARWGGNWVPRMLEEGVTATWGAVSEPYATFYAPGGNVFDHLWAGYNFAESFYIAENAARWVMVAVGDPLYAPVVPFR